MTICVNNAQFDCIISNGYYSVYVRISDILYKAITKKLPLTTVKDERYNAIFVRTTIVPSDIDRFKGNSIVFSIEKFPESDIYVLRPVAYKRKSEGIIHYESRLNDGHYAVAKTMLCEYESRNSMFGIKKVIHHDPATIVYWCDGTKTVVKCGENDIYDPEKGLAMAIAKKVLGNKGNYYNEFKKWLPKEETNTNTSDNQADEQAEYIKKSDVIINKNPNDSENTWGF